MIDKLHIVECSVPECSRPQYAKGLCCGHEKRLREHGDVQADVPLRVARYGDRRCDIDGCMSKIRARGLCGAHLERIRRNGHVGTTPIRSDPRRGTCTVDGCDREHQGRGFCAAHLSRVNRVGHPMVELPVRKNTGRYVTPDGYVMTSTGAGHPGRGRGQRIPEHRKVMELTLGRPLRPGENVHHKNGNRADNRPANLELWAKSQPAGQRVLDRLDWARQILTEYGGEEQRLREMEAPDERRHHSGTG